MLGKIEDVRVILRQYMKASREDINENSVRSYIDALIFKQQEVFDCLVLLTVCNVSFGFSS